MTSKRAARRAARLVEAYQKRFTNSPGHMQLATHAAFPAALTPDLLYRLAVNFQCDEAGNSLPIPWIAVADLLLSGLCSFVGGELYEMKDAVRRELLARLEKDPRFGPRRVKHLAEFVLTYADQFDDSADLELREVAESQRFVAQAYAQPEMAVSGLAEAMRLAIQQRDTGVVYRLRTVVDRMAESGEMASSGDFRRLQAAAIGLTDLVEGRGEEAVDQFKAASNGKPSFEAGGVEVVVPEPVQQMAGLDRQPEQAPNKVGYYLADARDFNGLDKWIEALSRADLPIFMTLAIPPGGSEGFFGFLAERLPSYRTVVVSEYMGDFVVKGLDPKEAAAEHWRTLSSRLRPDVPPDFWIEAAVDMDPRRAEWLGEFALAYADITSEPGLRLAMFGFSGGKPAVPDDAFWQTPSVRAFLERCAAEPDRLAVSFREILDLTVDRALFFQSGPIEHCYAACGRMGLPRPTTFVTELAWPVAQLSATILEGQELFGLETPQQHSAPIEVNPETGEVELKAPLGGSFGSHMPEPAEILEAARYYARYPSIKGAALWTKDLAVAGETLNSRFQRVIETLADRAAEERFDVWPDRPLQPYSELEPLSLTIAVQEDLSQDSADPASWREVATIDGRALQTWGEEPMAEVEANANVRFTWRLRNRGLTTWTPSFSFMREGDVPLIGDESIPLPPAAPGQIVEVSADFIEPDAVGRLSFRWKPFDDAGRPFQQELVTVVSNLPTFDDARLHPEDPEQISLVLAPRQQANVRWRLTNTGDTVWDETVELRLLQLDTPPEQRSRDGLVEAMGQLIRTPQKVRPGEMADFRYEFESPDDRGRRSVAGRLTGPRGSFGPTLGLTLTIESAENDAVGLESFQAPEGSTPGGIFPAAWLLRNTGNTTWGPAYSLVGLAAGDRQGTRQPLPLVMPGATAEISFDITVPTEPGQHLLEWELRDRNDRPFEVLELRMDVPATAGTGRETEPLYRLISSSFAGDELRQLAYDLNVDYEDLEGGTRTLKALSLQKSMARHGRLGDLLAELFRERPNRDLNDYLYLVVAEVYGNAEEMAGLLARFDLAARDFGGREKFAWGSRPWLEQKARALQLFAEENGRTSELLEAIRQRRPEADLSFYQLSAITFESGQRPPQRAEPDFLDFHVSITRGGSAEYRVVVRAPDDVSTEEFVHRPDGLGTTAAEILEQMREGPEATRRFGNMLRRFLLPGVQWKRFQDSHRDAAGGLRLRLLIEPAELRPLPWAYCFEKEAHFKGLDPQTPILQEVHADRYGPADFSPTTTPQPFRLLIAVTLYDSWSPVDEADLEQALVRTTTTGLGRGFQHTLIDKVNLEKLVAASQEYHALQIAGRATRLSDGRMAFVVEVKEGETRPLPVSDLAAARDWTATPLIILSGVASDAQEDPEPLHHAAYELVQGGVPAVIVTAGPGRQGTPQVVVAARRPLEALYRGLMKGRPLDRLATEMRIAAFAEDDIFWGLSTLYTTVPNAVIWTPLEQELVEGEVVRGAASITGTTAGSVGLGRLHVEQQVEEVSGSVTGATIGDLGGSSVADVGSETSEGETMTSGYVDDDPPLA